MLEALYQLLMEDVFTRAINDDAALCDAIAAFDGPIEFRQNELHFTLPALFDFLVAQSPDWPTQTESERHRDYLLFREIIAKNPTNETLSKHGAAVDIATLNEVEDRIVYRLVRTLA